MMKLPIRLAVRTAAVAVLAGAFLGVAPLRGHVPAAWACGQTNTYHDGTYIGVALRYNSCSHQASVDVYYEPNQCPYTGQNPALEAILWQFVGTGYTKVADSGKVTGACSATTGWQNVTCGYSGHGDGILWGGNPQGEVELEHSPTSGNYYFSCM